MDVRDVIRKARNWSDKHLQWSVKAIARTLAKGEYAECIVPEQILRMRIAARELERRAKHADTAGD